MPTYNVSISLYINVKNTAQITIKAENKEDAKEQARSIHSELTLCSRNTKV
jgi:hypothetical protein